MHYSDVFVSEPLDKIVDDWNFLNDRVISQFFSFKDVGDNVIGIRNIERDKVAGGGELGAAVSLPAVRKNFEIGQQGVIEVPRLPFSVHVTLAGTPHRTQHVFGYWHINDKDELIISLPPDQRSPGRVIIVMGKPEKGRETDRFAWYCDQCVTLLFLRESTDFSTFWKNEKAAVQEYNSDPRHRLCPSCGHLNPLGYSAILASDTPEQRQARALW